DMNCVYYHGKMTRRARERAVTEFSARDDISVLLMSHAGTYGLDVPAANWIINTATARSAGAQMQLNARHVRASSRHDRVHVVDLVVVDTLEALRHEQMAVKFAVSQAITDGKGIDARGRMPMRAQSLTEHLTRTISEYSNA